jgi:phasin protein
MSTTDETKSAGKSGRRKGKGKGEPRKKAVSQEAASKASLPETPAPAQMQSPDQELQQPQPDHLESPKVDQQPAIEASVVEQPAVEEPVVAIAASPEPQPTAAPSPSEPPPAAAVSADPPPAEPVSAESVSAESAPAEPAPVSLQALADAYRDYTRKSIEEFGSFVEQLSGVRSLDKAMTVQTEFVKRAYETSVAESQKICELHNRLAKQTLDPFKGLTGKAPTPHSKP